MHKIDAFTQAKVAEAGELVMRAAAVLGTLTEDQQRQIHTATKGSIPHSLAMFLRASRAVAPELERSLQTRPLLGLIEFHP